MRKTTLPLLLVLLTGALTASAGTSTFNVRLSNPLSTPRTDVPVVIDLSTLSPSLLQEAGGREAIRSAMVTIGGKEIACQLDDLDGDDIADELAFVADLGKK